jgi:hypothetical protein
MVRALRALMRSNRRALRWRVAVQTAVDAAPEERAAMARRAEREQPELTALVKALAIACEAEDWRRRTQ